jgi:hypothetical protein
VTTDFTDWLQKNGIEKKEAQTSESVSSFVTIKKQPESVTVTEGNIQGALSVEATVSNNKKLKYIWAFSKTNDTSKRTLTQKYTPSFDIPKGLKAGEYYYFCVLYVNGKEAACTDIATITVVKGENTIEINPEFANLKKGVNVLSVPTRTTYKVGEGFDTSGLKVVYFTGTQVNDISDKILFYTSKTVKLTQGRPFSTAGKKVVDLRQHDGKTIAKYTITVTK